MLSVLRNAWLAAVIVVAEDGDDHNDAAVNVHHGSKKNRGDGGTATAAMTVFAVLHDAQRRVAVLGGREGYARSLSSVYAWSVTRFLPPGFRCKKRRSVYIDRTKTPVCPHGVHGEFTLCFGIAFTTDGLHILATMARVAAATCCAIFIFDAHTGDLAGFVHNCSVVPQHLMAPRGLCVAPDDGFVFVADVMREEVVVLSPTYAVHGTIGAGVLRRPYGVATTADLVAVTEMHTSTVCVFQRATCALMRRVGSPGVGDGQLQLPSSLCFAQGNRHLVVVESGNFRASVFDVLHDGRFICHMQPHVRQSWRSRAFDPEIVRAFRDGDHNIYTTSITRLRDGELIVAFDDVTVFSAEYACVKTLHTHDVMAVAVDVRGSRAATIACAHHYGSILTLLE
jgi:hypothetical protein